MCETEGGGARPAEEKVRGHKCSTRRGLELSPADAIRLDALAQEAELLGLGGIAPQQGRDALAEGCVRDPVVAGRHQPEEVLLMRHAALSHLCAQRVRDDRLQHCRKLFALFPNRIHRGLAVPAGPRGPGSFRRGAHVPALSLSLSQHLQIQSDTRDKAPIDPNCTNELRSPAADAMYPDTCAASREGPEDSTHRPTQRVT